MYVFHGNLEAIETTSFCDLYFLSEPLHLEEVNECCQKDLSCRRTDAVTALAQPTESSSDQFQTCGLLTAVCRAVAPHSIQRELGKLLCFPDPPLKGALRRQKQNKGSEPAKC